ncbi:MAG: hypothetical protein JWQ18_2828 [Conexibacter sp.]|nr:hypothetical protein [Conexibacter sp.]
MAPRRTAREPPLARAHAAVWHWHGLHLDLHQRALALAVTTVAGSVSLSVALWRELLLKHLVIGGGLVVLVAPHLVVIAVALVVLDTGAALLGPGRALHDRAAGTAVLRDAAAA